MEHFADCNCLGPSNAEDDGWTIIEIDGELWAEKPLTPPAP